MRALLAGHATHVLLQYEAYTEDETMHGLNMLEALEVHLFAEDDDELPQLHDALSARTWTGHRS